MLSTQASDTIKYEREQLSVLQEVLALTPVHLPALNCDAYYSGLSMELLLYGVYPLMLDDRIVKSHQDPQGLHFVLGTSRPSLIFTAITEAFRRLWPGLPESDVSRWEVFKWNRAMYGKEPLDASEDMKVLSSLQELERPVGGKNTRKTVLLERESQTKRWMISVPVQDFLPKARPKTYIRDALLVRGEIKEALAPEINSMEVDEVLLSSEQKTRDFAREAQP